VLLGEEKSPEKFFPVHRVNFIKSQVRAHMWIEGVVNPQTSPQAVHISRRLIHKLSTRGVEDAVVGARDGE
jgi:hypothetical protein